MKTSFYQQDEWVFGDISVLMDTADIDGIFNMEEKKEIMEKVCFQ